MAYTKNRGITYTAVFTTLKSDYYPAGSVIQRTNISLVRSRTGDRLPRWKEKIAAGENATTNLDGTWETLECTPTYGYCRWFPSGGPWCVLEFRADGAFDRPSPGMAFPSWTSNAKARASAKFYSAVRESQVKMSGLTFMGELGETIRMFKRPLAGLQDSIKRYLENVRRKRNGRHKLPGDWTKDLSQLWLEHSYGWTPLMMDIADAKKAYNSLFEKERVVKVTGAAKDFRYDGPGVIEGYTFAGHPFYFQRRSTEQMYYYDIYRYRGAVHAQAVTTAQDRFTRFGFTPQEFIPTAWELLPWSFLVDYFTDIGDILYAAVTDTSTLKWVNESRVQISDWHQKHEFFLLSSFPYQKSSFVSSPGSSHKVRRLVTRRVGGLSIPSLTFRLPRNDFQLLNIAALLRGAIRDVHPQNPRPNRPHWVQP